MWSPRAKTARLKEKKFVWNSPSCPGDNCVLAKQSSHTKAVDGMNFRASNTAATRTIHRSNRSVCHVECLKTEMKVGKMRISNLCLRGPIYCSRQRNKFRKVPLAYDRGDVARLRRERNVATRAIRFTFGMKESRRIQVAYEEGI